MAGSAPATSRRIDADGWLTIVGRIKDVIIRGGENISTAEVEHELEAHAEVRQAVVVGYPDPLMGERVAAFVVAASAVRRRHRAAPGSPSVGVARFKTPERVIVVDELPTLADRQARPRRVTRPTPGASLREVTDRLDVVAVGIAHERAVVVRVVLGPHPRLVQHLGARRDRGVEERPDFGPIRRGERDVALADLPTRGVPGDPEVRLPVAPIAAVGTEVHDAPAPERSEHRVVEHRLAA